MIRFSGILFIILLFTNCNSQDNMQTVHKLDLQKYAGTWYEIYRLPFFPERNLVNITANYDILPDGKIEVINSGRKNTPDGKLKSIRGKAWRPDPDKPGRLKVRFFWPFKSDYLVLANQDYRYALVTGGSGNVLWFLSREPGMPTETFEKFKEVAVQNGIDISELITVTQEWEDR